MDVCAQLAEFLDDALVAALDVIDLVDLSHAVGGQTGHDHGGTGPQVAGAHRGTGQGPDALDHGDLAVDLDVGAHAAELVGIAIAVVPNALVEDAGPLGQAQDRRDLGLHVRGEAGVRHGLHVGAGELALPTDDEGVALLFDVHAHLHELGGDAVEMLGDDVVDADLTPGGGNGGHVGARLDLVGDDGVTSALELFHAPDLDDVRPRTHDVRAHGVEEVGQVHDVRLLGGVFDDGQAVG